MMVIVKIYGNYNDSPNKRIFFIILKDRYNTIHNSRYITLIPTHSFGWIRCKDIRIDSICYDRYFIWMNGCTQYSVFFTENKNKIFFLLSYNKLIQILKTKPVGRVVRSVNYLYMRCW